MSLPRVCVLELNELNFEMVQAYASNGLLPNFATFFARHGFSETTSENEYCDLEPWIQWVTVHTGMTLAEHRVFRLGDIVNTDIEQVWGRLADHGVSVGAVSPMNAKCCDHKWDFFIPDPWTTTNVIANNTVKRMYYAISQMVNDNAQKRMSLTSLLNLAIGAFITAFPGNYHLYLKYMILSYKKPWFRAIFLDLVLSDLYVYLSKAKLTTFSTLFLNAAAHIQHHYMFSSKLFKSSNINPNWYVPENVDPIFDVYLAYDRIIGNIIRTFPDSRIILVTGLHQEPHPEITYYWRLKDHANFLRDSGIEFERVEPRMSRDFVIYFKDAESARHAAGLISSAITDSGCAVFEVDNRGVDLFVTLIYSDDMSLVQHVNINQRVMKNIKQDVAFVAIKNGRHNGIGYYSDSGYKKGILPHKIELKNLMSRFLEIFAINEKKIDDNLIFTDS